MSATVAGPSGATKTLRLLLGIGGLVALIVGILILVWPLKTAVVVTAMIAVYAIITGIVYIGMAIFSKSLSGWSRVGHAVLGVLFVIAGIVAFFNLTETTLLLAVFVAVFIGISWVVDGIVSLTTLPSGGKGWTIFFAIVSIIAGIMLFIAPVFAAAFLWLFVAWSLVILGVVQIVRAFTIGRG
ncbi:HdeD family acid-resistance protein [Microbacterium sp. GXF7504]